ncbi:MAG: hypothetical protein KIT80_17245 [Chitinophagaceae bacterium]|nr:hypothetical protein [Chitinophagaceae bacterium]MCW5928668.1 hypothetical protein [Chitinophagaceae bacterium]
MKKSISAFKTYLDELEKQMKAAAKQPNPAFGLFLADARTPAFRLEGLARLYAGLHDKKLFSKLNKQVKRLEDGLGEIDHYAVLEKEFAPDTNVPVHIKDYFRQKAEEKTAQLNKLLKKEKWLGGGRVKAVKATLKTAKWMAPGQEIQSITDYYKKEVAKIDSFIRDCVFDDMENDVHELRRKVRWLSIYAMALQGKTKLAADKKKPEAHLKKYLLPKIIHSPFNKIVASGELKSHVTFRKNYFLALSWLIAELGRIKDDGLRIMALTEAYMHTESLTAKEAMKKTRKALGNQYPATETLLKKAADISKKFVAEGNLKKLVV